MYIVKRIRFSCDARDSLTLLLIDNGLKFYTVTPPLEVKVMDLEFHVPVSAIFVFAPN